MLKKIDKKSILVIGASGLIGNTIFRYLNLNKKFQVYGTVRNLASKQYFSSKFTNNLIVQNNISELDKWLLIFKRVQPNYVINCIGITKHLEGGNDPLRTIPINAYFPHYLNSICQDHGCRLIHISSDCVFSGNRGSYIEQDTPDATDFYGKSKALGEITQGPAITLRTSTIGHELHSSFGLLDWFLNERGSCQGYKNAFFSGIPTIELAKIIERHVIPNSQLEGLYHVGANKISKYDLLTQIAHEYGKKIEIVPNTVFKIDRSLNSDRFYGATGYNPPSWPQLIKEMHLDT